MKNLGTLLIYILSISVIPIATVFYIHFEEKHKITSKVKDIALEKFDQYVSKNIPQKEKGKDIVFEQFNKNAFSSVTINTRELLVNKKFKELNQYFEKLDKEYLNDITKEDLLFISYKAFGIQSYKYEVLFNSWIESTPDSYVPYFARGVYYYEMTWKERGERLISKIKDTQIKKMNIYLNKARKDLSKSLEINETSIFAYANLINIANTLGEYKEAINLESKALKISTRGKI